MPLQLGAGELGIRPEDVVIAVLTLRCLLFHPAPCLQTDVRRFVNAYLVLLVFVTLFTILAVATHPISEISWYPHAKALGVTAIGYVAFCAIRSRATFRHFTIALQIGGVILSLSAVVGAKIADTMIVAESSAYDAQMVAAKVAISSFAIGWNERGRDNLRRAVACGAALYPQSQAASDTAAPCGGRSGYRRRTYVLVLPDCDDCSGGRAPTAASILPSNTWLKDGLRVQHRASLISRRCTRYSARRLSHGPVRRDQHRTAAGDLAGICLDGSEVADRLWGRSRRFGSR